MRAINHFVTTAILLTAIIGMTFVCPPLYASNDDAPFKIRGTLPWHNFLSGPTAWNFLDYKNYLNHMSDQGFNFVGFHCYTGGARRYVNYVEPMIRVKYRDVLPEAQFDTSMTARWGYSQLKTDRFAFGSNRFFRDTIFGADCAVDAKNNEDRYRRAQILMKRVMDYAHSKEMKFCIGFEFGIYPPEFFSIIPERAMLRNPYLPDPTHPAHIEILRLYIQNILEAYPGIDYIWFWLQELNMPVEKPQFTKSFQTYYDQNQSAFSHIEETMTKINGIWAQAYILKAYEILQELSPDTKMAIGGWGSKHQLPPILKGLHETVPKEIIFTCLNPNQGLDPQLPIMGELSGRETWIIPWLEGDLRLWHPQPRVSLIAEQIAMALNQGIEGVIGIHWRTEDIRANFDALGQFTQKPLQTIENSENEEAVTQFYNEWCKIEYGPENAEVITPILIQTDIHQTLASGGSLLSPEYSPYEPTWGRITPELREEIQAFHDSVASIQAKEKNYRWRKNLQHLQYTLMFMLTLDEISRNLEAGFTLRDQLLTDEIQASESLSEIQSALDQLNAAPFKEMFQAYGKRVRSQGEKGVLSSLNQKVWLQAQNLKTFLQDQLTNSVD